jgi:hypothetical protein
LVSDVVPILTANWRAPDHNQWLVPFGGGFGKMTRFFDQAMVWQMHVYYKAIHRQDVPYPKWQVRFQVALLFCSRLLSEYSGNPVRAAWFPTKPIPIPACASVFIGRKPV